MQLLRTLSILSFVAASACGGGEPVLDTAPSELIAPAGDERMATPTPESEADGEPRPSERAGDFDRPRAPDTLSHGPHLGRFQMTYYWVADERRKAARKAARKATLYDKSCRPLARVSQRFARRITLEGTGKLQDGRIISAAGACSCPSSPCFFEAPRSQRWGAGVAHRPLSPFRSVAVDPRHVSIGQTLYIPELDGMTMPGAPPYGGFVHDGCVLADDRGGNVRGKQLDFFTAKKGHYRSLFRRHKLNRVTVFDGAERCRSLAEGEPREGTAVASRTSS